MAKQKPTCPHCGSKSFAINQTFAVENNCHYLERKRYAYYKCAACGCECLLTTPQGTLEIIRGGKVTRELALRVLEALNLPAVMAERLK